MATNYETEKKRLEETATTQQIAAADPKQSVWVEASAGTGKTKVLSDRVLRLLLAKVNPAKILCLTYTKAAAVEMSERIAKRLSAWAVEEDDKLKKELKKLLGIEFKNYKTDELMSFARTLFAVLLDTPGGMKIQTIHSFCQDVLKRFPLEAGISPYFEVMDDRNSKEILQDIKVEILQKTYDTDDSEIKRAVTYLTQNISEYKFPEIMNLITENRSKIGDILKSYNQNISLIATALEQRLEITQNITEDDIKRTVFNKINREMFKAAAIAFARGGKTDVTRSEKFTEIAASGFDTAFYEIYRDVFLTGEGTVRKSLATKDVVKANPWIVEFMGNEACKILNAENKIAALHVLHSTVSMLYIAKSIIDRYNTHKEDFSVLDYEDLIVITRKLLENSNVADWVLFKLDGGIEHVLIDEAQDTSPNQWAIIRALTQEFFAGIGAQTTVLPRTVFVVGDRKQSIYSFQGADPAEFDKMYHYFDERANDFNKIHLDVSFRSTKAIMDCVNTLFRADTAKKGVIPDNEEINHCPYRLGDGGVVEIMPILHKVDEEKEAYVRKMPNKREQKTSVSNQLARQLAQKIKYMVESGEILASKNRPVRYGDFMFLVQQRKSFVEEFVRACKECGVNVAGVDKLKLLEQIAVQDLISLGKFLLLPTDDLSLSEVLKSPIFGLDDDDLFNLCYERKGTVFNSLLTNPQYKDTADKLKELLNLTGYLRPFELFNHVLVKLGGRKNFICRMGNEVEDVLDEFLNLAIIFEQKHTPSLESFIAWIVEDEVVIQKEMEQGESDTVKIMTAHGSKGLQAPIVILADTTRVVNEAKKSNLLWDDDLVYFPTSSDNYDENCLRVNDRNIEAAYDEYRRLLYVALTRAEDRLYVAGFCNSKNVNEKSWFKLLQDNITSNLELNSGDKRIVYQIAQENGFNEEEKKQKSGKEIIDYSYLLKPAEQENPLAKPFAPSRDESDETEIAASPLEEQGNFYRRGTVIHKLLQYIGHIEDGKKESAIWEFLRKNLPDFSNEEQEKIVTEILNLCQTYAYIFADNSMAEVPIIGEADGKIVSAKIDRLVVEESRVTVVDYKTNRPAAKTIEEIPLIYLKQMNTYKALLKKVYPDKEVETYLLWTNTCNMMKV